MLWRCSQWTERAFGRDWSHQILRNCNRGPERCQLAGGCNSCFFSQCLFRAAKSSQIEGCEEASKPHLRRKPISIGMVGYRVEWRTSQWTQVPPMPFMPLITIVFVKSLHISKIQKFHSYRSVATYW